MSPDFAVTLAVVSAAKPNDIERLRVILVVGLNWPAPAPRWPRATLAWFLGQSACAQGFANGPRRCASRSIQCALGGIRPILSGANCPTTTARHYADLARR